MALRSSGQIRSYKDLHVWQRSTALVTELYKLTRNFPSYEQFGLSSQIQRAAVSIPANIAEGYGRNTRNEYANFIRIAHGSLTELETLLIIASNLSYCDKSIFEKHEKEVREIGAMLFALRQSVIKSC